MKIILIAAVCVLAAAAALLLLLRRGRGTITDGPGMVSEQIPEAVSYSRSGGMLGGHYSVTLIATEDGKAVLSVEKRESHSAPMLTQSYPVSAEALKAAGEVISRNGMEKWTALPPSQIVVLDAPTISVSLTYSDHSVSFGDWNELPGRGHDAVAELRECLLSFAKNENSALTLSADPLPESDTLLLGAEEYENGYLQAVFRNAGGQEYTVTDGFTVEKQEGGAWTRLEPREPLPEPESYELGPRWEIRVQCDLNAFGALTPGRYRISQGGLCAEFTLQ